MIIGWCWWIAGFLCGVGLTGKLMTDYYKSGWVKPHTQTKIIKNIGDNYTHRKR